MSAPRIAFRNRIRTEFARQWLMHRKKQAAADADAGRETDRNAGISSQELARQARVRRTFFCNPEFEP